MRLLDIAGFGKIGSEIIKSFGKAIGVAYRPIAIRKEADAQAYAITRLADANSKADAITRFRADDVEFVLQDRAAKRVVATAIQEQKNIEGIVERSLLLANESADQTAIPIDDGWFARFMDGAKSVTHCELREIWSAILARQAAEGQFSLRLLDCVRNLDAKDVEAFETFVWIKRSWGTLLTWPFVQGGERYHRSEFLTNDFQARLLDSGLIAHKQHSAVLARSSEHALIRLSFANHLLQFQSSSSYFTLHEITFTRIGYELEAIVGVPSEEMSVKLNNSIDTAIEKIQEAARVENLKVSLVE